VNQQFSGTSYLDQQEFRPLTNQT